MKQRRQSLNESPTPQDTRGNESRSEDFWRDNRGNHHDHQNGGGIPSSLPPPPSSKSPVETPLNEHPERFLDRSGCSVESFSGILGYSNQRDKGNPNEQKKHQESYLSSLPSFHILLLFYHILGHREQWATLLPNDLQRSPEIRPLLLSSRSSCLQPNDPVADSSRRRKSARDEIGEQRR